MGFVGLKRIDASCAQQLIVVFAVESENVVMKDAFRGASRVVDSFMKSDWFHDFFLKILHHFFDWGNYKLKHWTSLIAGAGGLAFWF